MRALWSLLPVPSCCVALGKKLNAPGLAGTSSGFWSSLHHSLSFVLPQVPHVRTIHPCP